MAVTDQECVKLKYARECVRLAGLCEDPLLRDQLLDMARSWMAETMHASAMPAPGSEDGSAGHAPS